MASLKYEIATHEYDKSKYLREVQKDKDGNLLDTTKITTQSERQYKNHAIKFGMWCKDTYGCRHFEDCRPHVQDFADFLRKEGRSPSTIHTYLAAVCRVWEIDLDSIQKPKRTVANNTRSRGTKAVDRRKDAQPEISPRLHEFATRIGFRRREYQRLRGGDLVPDETGHLCVRVMGKGGKIQYQRVLPEDEELVRSYFAGKEENEYIFDCSELRNKLDLHHLRALQAQRVYAYYLKKIQDPTYRKNLIAELEARWRKYNRKKKWSPKLVEGTYFLRGHNRQFARDHSLPTEYSRLALMAVSVFHLSHWRLDVTVANYILAV